MSFEILILYLIAIGFFVSGAYFATKKDKKIFDIDELFKQLQVFLDEKSKKNVLKNNIVKKITNKD